MTTSPARNPALPDCVICDIDGTLAIMGDRSPFEWEKVGVDTLNEPVAILLEMVRDYGYKQRYANDIIILSGRDGSCRPETEKWLAENGVYHHHLYMRKPKDNRKDAIVKRELYEEHILGKYNVSFVLDDRDQVVALWRKDLGLPCFQVNYGSF